MDQAKTLVLLARIRVLLDEGKTPEQVARELHDEIWVQQREKAVTDHSNRLHSAYVEWLQAPELDD